jgi:tRNA-2-methylthio-N6-dimethylallyladenosine synthase
MNEHDTQKLYKILEKEYHPVDAPEKADLVLINTCSVREKPEQKLYSMLGEMRELKATNPNMMVGVCGCVAQQEGEAILKKGRNVDVVFGTHNLSLVPSLIQLRKNGAPPQVAVNYREDWEELPLGFADADSSKK